MGGRASSKKVGREPRREMAVYGALLVASLAAFAPGLGGSLLNWDDDRFVENNPYIRGCSIENVREIVSRPHFEAYHPLHLLSYCADFALYGIWAPGYKLHNLVLYWGCLVLLYNLLITLGLGRGGALAGALVFAVHPLHVETVVWVTARKEPLSLLFMLASALAYLQARSMKDRLGVAAVVLFGLALLTKTSTVVLPALLFVAEVVTVRRPAREAALRLLPMGAVAAAVGLYVVSLWQENEMARPLPEEGTSGLVALVGKTYWHYATKTVWPSGLSPVYAIDRVGRLDLAAWAGFAFLAASAVVVVRGDRLAGLGLGWFAVALTPVSNAIPVYFFVQDRYAFVATVGAAVVAGRAYEAAATRAPTRWPARVLLVAVVLALGTGSALQARHWRSSLELWQRATSVEPASYYAFLALGHTERDRGELDAAVDAYGRAVANAPELPHARISLCLADALRTARDRGRPRDEVDEIGRALGQQWRSPQALVELAGVLLVRGYAACAQLAEARAFDLRAPSPATLVGAASRWTVAGQGELALRYLDRAGGPDAEPSATALEVRAQALELTGHPDEARQTLARSFELEPRPEHRLVAAAAQLLERGRPELALLYADVAGRSGELQARWSEIRRRAEAASSR